MATIPVVKHKQPMKLADGNYHLYPTTIDLVKMPDGETPAFDMEDGWTAANSTHLGGRPAEDYALKGEGGGTGVPAGGSAGQTLVKQSDEDGDAEWADMDLTNTTYTDDENEGVDEKGNILIVNADMLDGHEADYFAKANDLTAVHAKVEALESGVEIVPTVNGNAIVLDDASNLPLRGLKIYGKTMQDGTPTPDTPVELVTAGRDGEIKTYVTGKNVMPYEPNKTALTTNGVTFTPLGDGRYKVVGTATVNAAYSLIGEWKAKTGLTILPSAKKGIQKEGTGSVVIMWYGFNEAGVYESAHDERLMHTDVYSYLQIDTGVTVDAIVSPYISYYDRNYEPYKAQTLTLSTPNGLPGIPVTSGGNYTDASGQQWICDEIDLERGVKIQRTLHHSETVYIGDAASYGGLGYENITSVPYPTKNVRAVMCNIAPLIHGDTPTDIGNNGWTSTTPCVSHHNAHFRLYLPANSSYNAELLVALDEPIITELTDSELAGYRALVTNKPNTTIYNDAGCDQTVRYVADTTTYINNKIQASTASLAEELEAAKILLGVE